MGRKTEPTMTREAGGEFREAASRKQAKLLPARAARVEPVQSRIVLSPVAMACAWLFGWNQPRPRLHRIAYELQGAPLYDTVRRMPGSPWPMYPEAAAS